MPAVAIASARTEIRWVGRGYMRSKFGGELGQVGSRWGQDVVAVAKLLRAMAPGSQFAQNTCLPSCAGEQRQMGTGKLSNSREQERGKGRPRTTHLTNALSHFASVFVPPPFIYLSKVLFTTIDHSIRPSLPGGLRSLIFTS